MCRFSIPDFPLATDPETDPAAGPVKPDFESGEHDIGNSVWLKFDTQTILGKDFEFKVGKNTLTYGLIVALAGDFYGNYTNWTGDVEQISDNWDDTKPDRSIAIGLKVAKWLSDDTEGYLAAVLTTMNKERKEVYGRLDEGAEDVAQIFASFGNKYDEQYNDDTKKPLSLVGAYAWIALCNWDHFGQDAYNAYSALHTAALRTAKEAHDGDRAKADKTMEQAYFLEGYAQHFLPDLFSSGHLRTPRRRLHRNIVKDKTTVPPVYPADLCAQKMHNEDCPRSEVSGEVRKLNLKVNG